MKKLGWTIFGLFAAALIGGIGYAVGRDWSSKDGLGGLGGTFWSTLIGAVVGAAAAGIISFILAEIAASRTLNADRAKEKERRLILAQTAMARVIRMHSGLNIIRSHIEESMMLANARNDLLRPRAEVVRSLANRFSPIEFPAEEQAVIRRLGDNKLTNTLLELDAIYNDTTALMMRYSDDRSALFNDFGGTVSGDVATTDLTEDQRKKFMPRFAEVDSIIRHLISRAQVDFDQAAEVIVRLETAGKRAFGAEFGSYESKYPDHLPFPIIVPPASPEAKALRKRRKTRLGRLVRTISIVMILVRSKPKVTKWTRSNSLQR